MNANKQRRDEGYPGEKARQGEIILSTRTRQLLFFGLPVLFVVAILLVTLFV